MAPFEETCTSKDANDFEENVVYFLLGALWSGIVFYADVEKHKNDRHRVRCFALWGTYMYMDAQGNLLCLSRAPPGPLLALWGTWIRRETLYADL